VVATSECPWSSETTLGLTEPIRGMHRILTGRRKGQHVLSVPPSVVFYAIESDQLTVLTVTDAGRRQQLW
jgi:hypothetical protein